MKPYSILALLAVAGASFAGTYFETGSLTTSDLTFDNPGGSSLGSGIHYYDVIQFTVDLTGNYTFETASPRTSATTVANDALDTYIRVYANTFNPLAPGAGIANNDDFTGALTVLPGPYAGTVGPSGTGFQNAQPASRLASVALTAGVTYFMINTSFRETNYNSGTSTANAQATGRWFTGISGPGNIQAVPEPASMTALALGAAAMLRRRRAAKK